MVWETRKKLIPSLLGKMCVLYSSGLSKQAGRNREQSPRIFQRAEINIPSPSVHLKVEENVVTDFLSQKTLMKGEWMPNPKWFSQITKLFGRNRAFPSGLHDGTPEIAFL